MLYPKKSDQMELIGRKVKFTGELTRGFYKNGKCKWKIIGFPNRLREGKIVGFGCTYNGHYTPAIKDFDGEIYFDQVPEFINNKRIVHVKVRMTGEGPAYKIPPKCCEVIYV